MLSREVRDLLANAVGFAPSHEVRRHHSPATGPSVTLVNTGTMAPPEESSTPEAQTGATNPPSLPGPSNPGVNGQNTPGPSNPGVNGQATPSGPNKTPFDSVDIIEEDQPKVATKVGIWSFQYDPDDLKLWFAMLEDQLTMLGVRSQYLKRMALAKVLPPDVKKAAAYLLCMTWSEAEADDNMPYRKVKVFIMETFGPKEEDLVSRLNQLRMTAKPSELGHQLIELVCSSKLVGCTCCAKLVYSFWIAKMPENVKAAVAGSPKFGEDSYIDTFKLADAVWQATRAHTAAVAAASISSNGDDSGEVAALKCSVKSKAPGPEEKGKKKTSDKPKTPRGICRIHVTYGTDARRCAGPSWCALANIVTDPQIQHNA